MGVAMIVGKNTIIIMIPNYFWLINPEDNATFAIISETSPLGTIPVAIFKAPSLLNPKKSAGIKQNILLVIIAIALIANPKIRTSFESISLISDISPIDVKKIGIKNLSKIVSLS